MNAPAESPRVEIAPGVVFDALVGGHNRARNLTTGVVTFQPGAQLPYHTHPFAESVTVLSGKAAFTVQGRRYVLGPLDNVYVRPETAHAVVNLSCTDPAVFHIAMSSDTPTRTLVDDGFTTRDMPEEATGTPGAERVNRHDRTPVYEIASGARFQDFFNRDLGCPEMSGGYGRFAPGGRLPCHLHDFDESISIIEGTATCVVEGKRYSLGGNATALVPRGRCHYFINESSEPMAMIWVYAGPMPERVVLAEKCCAAHRETAEGGR
jgi:quercetin dioxygenase-like cupin family protein